MADSLCFALLRTTTLQILQSAGFESSNIGSADVLTDVFSRYIELLGQTTAELAEHSGRIKANALDTNATFSELHIDINSLKEWLEFGDGKVLAPSWTSGNDPGQVLSEVVQSGCPVRDPADAVTYEYKIVPDDIEDLLIENDDDALTDSSDEDINEDDNEIETPSPYNDDQYGKHQSSYIPNHLPPLPMQSLDEENVSVTQPVPPTANNVQKQNAPAPKVLNSILMKTGKRKVPKEPYKHKIPFEDSYLGNLDIKGAEDSAMPDIQPSSLRERNENVSFEKVSKYVERKTDASAQATKRHKGWASAEHHTEGLNPNRTMTFSDELVSTTTTGMLEKIIQKVAPSAAVSKLSSPNLWTDVIANGSNLPEEVITKPIMDGSDVVVVNEKPPPGPSPTVKRAKSNSISSAGVTIAHTPKKAEPVRAAAPTSLAALAASEPAAPPPKKNSLTLSLPAKTQSTQNQPTTVAAPPPTSADSSTPKIRFKLKLPVAEPVPAAEAPAGDAEVINCICETPHVDYGAFMIACDQCSVWFHGDCVGIKESDQVAEWYCMRCR